MNKKTMAASVALCMLAMGLIPTSSADPCALDGFFREVDPANGVTCAKKTQFGPNQITFKESIVEFKAARGMLLGGIGGVFFDVNPYTPGVHTGLNIAVWAEFIGPINSPDASLEGFDMTVCSDRNDNKICTPNNDPIASVDDYVTVYASNEPAPKDTKTSSALDAEAAFCVNRDIPAGGGDFDEVFVFIGSYIDESDLLGNIGTSAGNFDIYLDTSGGVVGACPMTPTQAF